ncbi:hypothetical protein L207DRAFT_572222 [Hyaloscypha variabilis F]|uniref:Extracellular membrane protein CFEM domain-containing protein n=1 Tax=Hyaloscypha variabilis (strain UAMH 11265 / GT02V1 / F) TaxID=1149755 RepID=A0A2J6R1T2_HYAVF|nr:hypothetical protein L207DRAFT_572222 [Hyaloscypha variabilis F]
MEASEMERESSVSPAEAEIELSGEAAQEILEIESQVRDITIIPPCILNCLYPRVLKNGCAHSNYVCFCYEMSPALVDPEVQLCLKQCPFLGEQLVAQGSIMDFCEVDGVDIAFPLFMSQYGIHHRRAVSSGGVSQSAAQTIPQATPFTTITSTLPWGYSPYYYTQPEGDDGTATVVYAAADISISTTYYITTTIPSGQAEYISTFTNKKSAAITEVIAVTSGGTPQSTSSISPNNPASQPKSQGSSGLSSGAKIGIGVTVPIVFILLILALIFFLHKRKKPPQEHQEGDEGLPEPISNISELKAKPPSFPSGKEDGLHVEAQGVPIHEMNATNAELRYEADGNPRIRTQNGLAATPAQAQPLPQQTAPVPTSNVTSAFPQPWNNPAATEYEYPQIVNQSQGVVIEDPEIAQLEAEAARMKKKRERLQEMQELEEREEEIRRSILEKKKAAASGT